MKLSPNELAQFCLAQISGSPDMDLDKARCFAARIDSRNVEAGDLFVCLKGERADGHEYAKAACERGASFLLAARELPEVCDSFPKVCLLVCEDPSKSLQALAKALRARMSGKVLGVTGTAGKTTLKEWLYASLTLAGRTARTRGNFNNQLGLPLSIANTRGDEDFWVLEAGISKPGDMEELAEILAPDIGIVLNVGTGHTEGLGKIGVAFHKTRMFKHLAEGGMAVASADYLELSVQTKVVCAESGKSAFLFATARDERELADKKADTMVHAIAMPPEYGTESGTTKVRLFLRDGDGACQSLGEEPRDFREWRLSLPILGAAAVENAACAGLVLHLLGLSPLLLEKGAANADLPEHRYAKRQVGSHLLVDDCYNANPLSMARMVEAAHAEARALGLRFVVVLGAMRELGNDAELAHRALGRQLAGTQCARVFWKGEYAQDVERGLQGAVPFATFSSDEEFSGLFDDFAGTLTAEESLAVFFKGSRSNRLESLIPIVEGRLAQGKNTRRGQQDPRPAHR